MYLSLVGRSLAATLVVTLVGLVAVQAQSLVVPCNASTLGSISIENVTATSTVTLSRCLQPSTHVVMRVNASSVIVSIDASEFASLTVVCVATNLTNVTIAVSHSTINATSDVPALVIACNHSASTTLSTWNSSLTSAWSLGPNVTAARAIALAEAFSQHELQATVVLFPAVRKLRIHASLTVVTLNIWNVTAATVTAAALCVSVDLGSSVWVDELELVTTETQLRIVSQALPLAQRATHFRLPRDVRVLRWRQEETDMVIVPAANATAAARGAFLCSCITVANVSLWGSAVLSRVSCVGAHSLWSSQYTGSSLWTNATLLLTNGSVVDVSYAVIALSNGSVLHSTFSVAHSSLRWHRAGPWLSDVGSSVNVSQAVSCSAVVVRGNATTWTTSGIVWLPNSSVLSTITLSQSRFVMECTNCGALGSVFALVSSEKRALASAVALTAVRVDIAMPAVATGGGSLLLVWNSGGEPSSTLTMQCIVIASQQVSSSVTVLRLASLESTSSALIRIGVGNFSASINTGNSTSDSSNVKLDVLPSGRYCAGGESLGCFPTTTVSFPLRLSSSTSQSLSSTKRTNALTHTHSGGTRTSSLSKSRRSATPSLTKTPSMSTSPSRTPSPTLFPNVTALVVSPTVISADTLLESVVLAEVVLLGTSLNVALARNSSLCSGLNYVPLSGSWLPPSSNQSIPDIEAIGFYLQDNATFIHMTSFGATLFIPPSPLFQYVTTDVRLWFTFPPLCTARADLVVHVAINIARVVPLALVLPSAETVVLNSALVVAVVGVCPMLANEVARVAQPFHVLACSLSDAPLAYYQSLALSSTAFVSAAGSLRFVVALLVVNGAIIYGWVLVHIAVAAVRAMCQRATLLKGFIDVGFPSLWMLPLFALFQPTVMASVTLVAASDRFFWTWWMGIACCLVCILTFFVVAVRHICYFSAHYVAADDSESQASLAWRIVVGPGDWDDVPGEEVLRYTRRHFLWFADMKEEYAWWMVAELALSGILGATEGMPLGEGACVPWLWVSAICVAVRLVALLWARPFRSPVYTAVCASLAACELLTTASIIAHGMLSVVDVSNRAHMQETAEWAARVGVYLVMAGSVFAIINRVVQLAHRNRTARNPSEKMSSSTLFPRMDGLDVTFLEATPGTTEILSLLEKVTDELQDHASDYDAQLLHTAVSLHLEFLLPGCMDDARSSLLELLRELDVAALERGRKGLFTPNMAELFRILKMQEKSNELLRSAAPLGRGRGDVQAATAGDISLEDVELLEFSSGQEMVRGGSRNTAQNPRRAALRGYLTDLLQEHE